MAVATSLPPPERCDPAEAAGAALVEAVRQRLAKRPDIGVVEMRRRAEAALALLELLEELEAELGPKAAALLREEAA